MSLSFRTIFASILHSKWAMYPLIAFAPMYMRPLGFVGENRPLYARLKGLWGAPLVGAGLAAKGGQELFSWLYFQHATVDIGDIAAFERMKHATTMGAWGFFVMTAVIIYGIALIRWVYHLGAFTICRRFDLAVIKIPLLYFVVTTATFGLWLGISVRALAWMYESAGAQGHTASRFVSDHPYVSVAAVLAVGMSTQWAFRNGQLGMKAVYANSSWLVTAIYAAAIPLLLLLQFLSSRV